MFANGCCISIETEEWRRSEAMCEQHFRRVRRDAACVGLQVPGRAGQSHFEFDDVSQVDACRYELSWTGAVSLNKRSSASRLLALFQRVSTKVSTMWKSRALAAVQVIVVVAASWELRAVGLLAPPCKCAIRLRHVSTERADAKGPHCELQWRSADGQSERSRACAAGTSPAERPLAGAASASMPDRSDQSLR
jgi:hypothetical protein